jgi:hypothetical protein
LASLHDGSSAGELIPELARHGVPRQSGKAAINLIDI